MSIWRESSERAASFGIFMLEMICSLPREKCMKTKKWRFSFLQNILNIYYSFRNNRKFSILEITSHRKTISVVFSVGKRETVCIKTLRFRFFQELFWGLPINSYKNSTVSCISSKKSTLFSLNDMVSIQQKTFQRMTLSAKKNVRSAQ
jgi:hypothetical protein